MSQVPTPTALKSEEKVLEQAMTSMIDLMSRLYRNQVILELNQTTIDKFQDSTFRDSKLSVVVTRSMRFIDSYEKYTHYEYERDEYGDTIAIDMGERERPVYKFKDEKRKVHPRNIIDGDRWDFTDAQTGNYAAILTKLATKVSKSLVSRFNNKRIEKLINTTFAKDDRRSKQIFYERMAREMGVDPTTLLKKDGMTYDFNALVLETTQWAKKLRDETLELYTANTLRAMTLGQSVDDILEQYDGMVSKRKNHAEFTARNQIQNFNSIMNKTRSQKLGITKAVWVTSGDERVRPCHKVRNGKEFELDKGLYSSCDGKWLLPGTDFNCRCSYRMVIPDDE